MHKPKINSEKFNMYVVGSYIKYVYDVIYLHIVKINSENIVYIYMCIKTIFIRTLKPYSSNRNS